MNIDFAYKVILSLKEKGVDTFCYSSGSRNAPFIEVLTHSKDLKVFEFFDERSMSFFAVGRAKRDQKPVGVVTTSGTAVFELASAAVEAHFSTASLALITCDRPSAYKGSGAPQCVDQENAFNQYVGAVYDLESSASCSLDLSSWDIKESIHLNVRFDEPTLDQKTSSYSFPVDVKNVQTESDSIFTDQQQIQIQDFFQTSKKPIVIVSEIPTSIKEQVKEFLLKINLPCYLEPLSNLREDKDLQNLSLKSGSSILNQALENKMLDGALRIGSIPVLRFWRDLNEINIPVLSLSQKSFSGLKERPDAIPLINFIKSWGMDISAYKKNTDIALLDQDQSHSILHNDELKWFRWLSLNIPRGSHIFLGNSNPIRYWDLASSREQKGFTFSGNRGANGIDGLCSSFLGTCHNSKSNYCILGDLSLLYDLSAPWILKQMSEYKVNIIVINNFGGQIFKPMYPNPAYLNSHQLNFKDWAHMWNLHYQCIKDREDVLHQEIPSLIEIQTHT